MLTVSEEDALARRLEAKAEIDRLKTIVAACDTVIMNALDSEDDIFMQWVREVRGEVESAEHRKLVWTDSSGSRWTVSKRKGKTPSKTIVPEKLLALGVPASVIQMATVTGQPGKPGVSIRRSLAGYNTEEDDNEE